jgi:hypothetical protein
MYVPKVVYITTHRNENFSLQFTTFSYLLSSQHVI